MTLSLASHITTAFWLGTAPNRRRAMSATAPAS